MIRSVFIFGNMQVAVCDEHGLQMPEFQGHVAEVWPALGRALREQGALDQHGYMGMSRIGFEAAAPRRAWFPQPKPVEPRPRCDCEGSPSSHGVACIWNEATVPESYVEQTRQWLAWIDYVRSKRGPAAGKELP